MGGCLLNMVVRRRDGKSDRLDAEQVARSNSSTARSMPWSVTQPPSSSNCTASAPRSPASSWSPPVTTTAGSTARQPSRRSAASRHNPPAAAAPPDDTDSAEEATAPPTAPSTSSPWSECGATSPPSTTSNAAPPKASANERSSAASSATSPARSTPTCPTNNPSSCPNTGQLQTLDKHRSIERFHRTLADGGAYARCYTSEIERRDELEGWLHYYNPHRPHTACGNQPPASRLRALSEDSCTMRACTRMPLSER